MYLVLVLLLWRLLVEGQTLILAWIGKRFIFLNGPGVFMKVTKVCS
ncbi:hypothetical protein Pint_11521 [Pistacia integerrima]|uniref:Uncharacterized protein n=1 Tax=Pistacia integerrima TaxID=434235 RepID=A0ACC0XMG6_9ROSI|nr:hypothetical protein Pint_11521 [Pistacia integerrima]